MDFSGARKKLKNLFQDQIDLFLGKLFPKRLSRLEKKFSTFCFSQTGEDAILSGICPEKGFYIDVGANHPFRYSNTHLLYRRGWRGINVDPNPGTKKLFDRYRPGDINLEIAIGKKKEGVEYHIFEESCFNTFSPQIAQDLIKKKVSNLLAVNTIPTFTLAEICHQKLPPEQKVGLLNVDAEGADVEILQSHDWNSYSPACVVVERLHGNLSGRINALGLLLRQGYVQIAQTPFSAIFRHQPEKKQGVLRARR